MLMFDCEKFQALLEDSVCEAADRLEKQGYEGEKFLRMVSAAKLEAVSLVQHCEACSHISSE